MDRRVQRLLDHYYPRDADGVRFRDGARPLYGWMLSTLEQRAIVLNVGAGPTPPEPQRRMRGKVGWLVGVDPDPVVLANEDLDEAHVTDGTRLPFADATFDAVYCDWTLEHVAHPGPFLREIHRVLKPDASFWFRTSNQLHYASLVAGATPHAFHRLVANRVRSLPASAHEPWPTRYRMNRRARLTRLLRASGFCRPEILMLEPPPLYLVFNPLAFSIGIAYERAANRADVLSNLRHHIIGRACATGDDLRNHTPATQLVSAPRRSGLGAVRPLSVQAVQEPPDPAPPRPPSALRARPQRDGTTR